jgi:hypothetical protein
MWRMRVTSLVLAVTVFGSPVVAAAEILPRMVAAISDEAPAVEPFVNRASAREVARFETLPRQQRLAPNLRHEADVETLRRPVELNPTREQAVKIVAAGAHTMRVQISGAAPGSVLWFAGEDDADFQRFEARGGVEWSPTTAGSTMYVAVEDSIPAMNLVRLATGRLKPAPTSSAASCSLDVCSANPDPEIDAAGRAIALIRFVRDDASYVCTGGLVNDAAGSGAAFFLTAHHCISTQEEAASIEVVWDERSKMCGDRSRRTYGADLLVSSPETDVALLRLHSLPENRVFLGIDLKPMSEGTLTYRLSHGAGAPQQYTAGVVRTTGLGCSSAPRPQFVYSTPTSGAVSLGSSGAPLLLPGLRIAGQLLGVCGPQPEDTCGALNDMVDGSISASWPMLAPFLDPQVATKRRAAR